MTFRRCAITALLSACVPLVANAQASAPPLALPDMPGASGPPVAASGAGFGPRLRSLSETGAGAAAPGDLKPERSVSPQISIPFGKKAPPPTPQGERMLQRSNASTVGGVDDAAARCESLADSPSRDACRAKAAPDAHVKSPK